MLFIKEECYTCLNKLLCYLWLQLHLQDLSWRHLMMADTNRIDMAMQINMVIQVNMVVHTDSVMTQISVITAHMVE